MLSVYDVIVDPGVLQAARFSRSVLWEQAVGYFDHRSCREYLCQMEKITGGVTEATNTWQQYTYSFTATDTNTQLSFLFRQDPAYWYFDDVSVKAAGSSTNLVTNPGFENGSVSGNANQPVNWSLIGTAESMLPACCRAAARIPELVIGMTVRWMGLTGLPRRSPRFRAQPIRCLFG